MKKIKHNLQQIQICLDEGNFVNIPFYIKKIEDILTHKQNNKRKKTK